MTRIIGHLRLTPGSWQLRQHPEGLPVVAVDKDGCVVAQAVLGPYDDFELEVPEECDEVQIRVALPGVTPTTVVLEGKEIEVALFFDNNPSSRL